MNKHESLKENKDFKRAYNKGKFLASGNIVTYVLKNRFKSTRAGITTSKKIGNAVERNRARRIIRAAFFDLKSNLKQGYDIVFVARAKTPSVKMQDVLKDMTHQLKKMDMFI